jgi:hypothetical protein
MIEGSTDTPIRIPAWLVRLCKLCWRGRRFIFGTLIGGTLLNAIYTLPFFDPATLKFPVMAWLLAHWYVLPVGVLFLALLTVLCGLIARLSLPLAQNEVHPPFTYFPTPDELQSPFERFSAPLAQDALHPSYLVQVLPSMEVALRNVLTEMTPVSLEQDELRRWYLERITRDTELATLKGIPAGLISESVRLADIYIPPRFHANRARVDFPVSNEDLERYRAALKRGGMIAWELERVVFEAEHNWHLVFQMDKRVGLEVVWERLNGWHAVVIQGYPGMGKSTLMERLTLHMAARGLGRPDPEMPAHEKLMPTLLPVLLRLGSYARALAEKADLSLSDYLVRTLESFDLPGLTAYVQQSLADGACLVMLDGLDEVSDPERREKVQREIKALVSGNSSRSRFIVTSRVAGYDQAAFPDYPHFTLAELDKEEIDYFLPRWSRASLERERMLRSPTADTEADLARDVTQRVRDLKAAIEGNQGVYQLAKNPLLLTLLLVMQQNSIVLPRRRVELYDIVTKTLLENRQIAKDLDPIPEIQAMERLGPLAFRMQETDSEFMRQRDVEEALADVISREGGTEKEIQTEAKRFLKHIRERGGLFVSRVGDYFGFMHRTFQEYFAARYILNNMKTQQDEWIKRLIQLVRYQGSLWREPFLLAVAYQSNENANIASLILRTLLANPEENSVEEERFIVMLATDALIEAKPLALGSILQTKVATRLLACYAQAQRQGDFEICEKIESCLRRWLLGLPKEAYRLPLLDVIVEAIKDVDRQRSVLTLLTMIAQELEPCSSLVFSAFIPPLLALTGLPAIGPYSPSDDLTISDDFDVIDLAFSALSFFGKRGPSGLYLETVKQYFEQNPAQLQLLARYSLEGGTLITPYQRAIKIA